MNTQQQYAPPRPSVVDALLENISSMSKVARPLFGWFVVSVFIVGVPRVVEISASGIKQGFTSVKCSIVSCDSAAAAPSQSMDDDEILDRAFKILEKANPGKEISVVAKPKK